MGPASRAFRAIGNNGHVTDAYAAAGVDTHQADAGADPAQVQEPAAGDVGESAHLDDA
jgi:hypothetical protein